MNYRALYAVAFAFAFSVVSAPRAFADPPREVRVEVTYEITSDNDEGILRHREPLTKTIKTGETETKTERQEKLFEGLVGGLQKVELLMDGWEEVGRRKINGKTFTVMAKTVTKSVEKTEEKRIGESRAEVTIKLNPAVNGEELACNLSWSGLKIMLIGAENESADFRQLKEGLFKAKVEQELQRLAEELKKPVKLDENELDELFGKSAGSITKNISFTFFGKQKSRAVRINSKRKRIVRGAIGL